MQFRRTEVLLLLLMLVMMVAFGLFCFTYSMNDKHWLSEELMTHRLPFHGGDGGSNKNKHGGGRTKGNHGEEGGGETGRKKSEAELKLEYRRWLRKKAIQRRVNNVTGLLPLEEFRHFDASDPSLRENDVTFLFGIINIGRKAHLGKEGKEYTFEGDYVQQLIQIIRFFKDEPKQVIIQRQYFDLIKPHLGNNTVVRFVEVEDLRNFKHYKEIEAIRRSEWWIPMTPWLPSVPQGYSDLYNPLVMQKVLWLRDLAASNPFKTKYFMWLDSGGICTPGVRALGIPKFKRRVIGYMERGFLITTTAYPQNDEIHGCQRTLLAKTLHGIHPSFVTKGWLMGGRGDSVLNIADVYSRLLARLLRIGCLGTEETVFTALQYIRPRLFSFYHNGKKDEPWQGGFCDFLYDREEDSEFAAMLKLPTGMSEEDLAESREEPLNTGEEIAEMEEEDFIFNPIDDPDSMEKVGELPQERYMKKLRQERFDSIALPSPTALRPNDGEDDPKMYDYEEEEQQEEEER